MLPKDEPCVLRTEPWVSVGLGIIRGVDANAEVFAEVPVHNWQNSSTKMVWESGSQPAFPRPAPDAHRWKFLALTYRFLVGNEGIESPYDP